MKPSQRTNTPSPKPVGASDNDNGAPAASWGAFMLLRGRPRPRHLRWPPKRSEGSRKGCNSQQRAGENIGKEQPEIDLRTRDVEP